MSEGVLDRFRLDDRVAVVTGAARGLGRAIAGALSSAGASVVVTSRELETAVAAAAEISTISQKPARGLELEVTRPDSIEALVRETVAELGRIDILVNNAGMTHRGPLGELTGAQWDEVLDTNLKGAWLCCKAVHPIMRQARWGRVINISSMFSEVALPNRTPYVASKGGMTALTRALALEFAGDGINVNALCPGPFRTEMHDDKARAGMLSAIPLGRFGNPAELGPAAVFLASEASSFITGTTLAIDGGYTAR